MHKQEIQHQKEISQQFIDVQENERRRIAVVLHDEVGNKLNILSLWINNDDTWNTNRSKDIIAQQIPELIKATRNISYALYPIYLKQFGLLLTLEELVSTVNSSLSVKLFIHHNYTKRPIYFELHMYRIIQEFLSNVIKHSKASEMNIQIRDTAHSLSILLTDNGIGFNKETSTKGMGLINIESRIQSIGAIFKWKNEHKKGSRLIILISKL